MKIAFDRKKIRLLAQSKAFIITVAAMGLYSLAGFFLAPWLIHHYLPRRIHNTLQTEASLGTVRFNPYLFKLEMHAFRMTGADGEAIAGFQRLLMDFELKSLFHWAWVFREIRVEGPFAHAVIQKEGGLNLANLVPPSEKETPQEAPSSQPPPRLIFENIRLMDGRLTFTDRRPKRPAEITLASVEAALSDLSTLPGRQAQTTLSAVTDQREGLQWQGQIGLNPVSLGGRLQLRDIQSTTLAAFAGDALRLGPPAGTIAAEADCLVEMRPEGPHVLISNLSLLVKKLSLAAADAPASPFLKLPEARMTGARLDLNGRRIDLGTVTIKGGSASLSKNERGVLNLQRIVAPAPPAARQAKPPATGKEAPDAWAFQLGGLSLDGFGVLYEDRGRTPALKGAIAGIKAHLAAETGVDGGLQVKDILLRLADVQAGSADAAPAVRLTSATLEKGELDLGKQRLKAARIAIDGGELQVERRIEGRLNLAQLFFPVPDQAATPSPAAAEAKPTTEKMPGFQFRVEQIALSGLQATVWDRKVREGQPILHVETLSAGASQVDGHSPMPVELALGIREGGGIKVAGTLDPGAGSLTAKIEVTALALATFQPYLEQMASAVLKSGTFSTTGSLSYGIAQAEAQTVYQGGFKVENLRVVETDGDETVLGWKQAFTEQLKLTARPNKLEIGDLRVQDLRGKTIIEKDGSFNLANLVKKDASDRPDASRPTNAEPAAREAPFAYHVRRVLINEGGLTFADRRLWIPFEARIHELRGNIAGISSIEDARSELRLRGRVDEFGTARAEGEINSSDPKAFADIKVAFRNLEMSRLTPYSGQFAGRTIDAGKLTVDLTYAIEEGRLKGENQLIVEQLKLGEKVESPDAVDLPLDLAVALLKDSKGVINLGLPVRGDLNNPQFSFGALVGKALVNALKKVATTPFRALGALIPGGDEKTLDRVAFDPGRATVPPPEREKLLQLVAAMRQRPQLKLAVQGRYHPEKDRRSLARRSLRQTVTLRLGQTVSDDGPNPLDYSSSETRKVLEAMFEERFGEEALEAFEDEMKAARKEGQASDAGFYAKELFARLLTTEQVPEDRLVELAQARTQAVIAEMSGPQGLPPDRLGSRPPVALDASSEEITAALGMEARP